jgi:hypothetical protein
MDGPRFDRLTRAFATTPSRRRLLAGLTAGALGLIGVRGSDAARCRSIGNSCLQNGDCCTNYCATQSRTRRLCECPPGTVNCHNVCVDPATAFQSDPANCGGCDIVCPRTTCQIGVCAQGSCGLAPDPNALGASCNDGDGCTLNDVCQADGSCAGAPVVCAAIDQCHDAGVCNPATGVCSNPAKANGAPCNDGNACTQSDSCQNGVCTSGAPMVCTASDQCHDAGVCDAQTGQCTNPPKADGAACDDGDACTQTDICQGGVCIGTNPVGCPALDQCHDVGTCDPTTGQCTNPPKADGAACGDGDPCTTNNTCQGGVCSGGEPVVCPAPDECHDAGTCDPSTGQCTPPEKANGSACSGGTCCNGNCCPSGSFCCGNGANGGCCAAPCCGDVCCAFDNSVCCPDQTCRIGVPCD